MPGAAPPEDPAFHLLLVFLMQKVLERSWNILVLKIKKRWRNLNRILMLWWAEKWKIDKMSIHSSRQVSISTLYPQQLYSLRWRVYWLVGWLRFFSSPLTEHTDCSLLITLLELNLNQRLYSKGQWTCSVLIDIFCGKILGISPH